MHEEITYKDIIGKSFNDVIILNVIKKEHQKPIAFCKCICGKTFTCLLQSIKSGNTKSCGCRKLRVKKNVYNLFNDYAELLIKDKKVIIDRYDYDLVSSFNWYLSSKGYPLAATTVKYAKYGRIMSVARLLLNFPDGYVDHINRDRLDNRRNNLRIVSNRSNSMNSTARKNSTSSFKGVSASGNKWKVMLGKTYLGTFDNEVEAALAYDSKARLVYGQFAYLNFGG